MKFQARAIALGVLAWALSLPTAANAVPVFKYDTTYKLSGTFAFSEVGNITLGAESTLFYDSANGQLIIDAVGTSNKHKGGELNLDFLLGDANPKGGAVEVNDVVSFKNDFIGKVEFDYHPTAMKKNGMTQIGNFSPEFTITFGKNRTVPVNSDNMIFSTGMNPFIFVEKGQLVFQSWLGIWGHGWDIHADPKFYLTELPPHNPPHNPPNEIPEPFTMGLLATGLLGGAAVRRRHRS